jgi:DNA-binding transcriptional LysR family regulator
MVRGVACIVHERLQPAPAMSSSSPRALINLRQLEVLRAVMRYRTTIGAAEELGMSQPAVSNAIKLAEAKIGFPLFDRISNRLVPTQEARILFADAEPLFMMHQAIQQKAWDLRTGRAGVLRIFATAELSEFLVPKVLRHFVAEHPEVKITLEIMRMDELLDGVETGIADVGVAMKPPMRPGLIREVLVEAEIMCISPMDDPLAGLPVVTPHDLRGRRLVGPPPGSPLGAMIEDVFQRSGDHFAPDFQVRFNNVASTLVEEGLGIGLVDELTAKSGWHSKFKAHRFRPRVPIPVCAMLAREKPPQRLPHAFIGYARKLMQEQLVAVAPMESGREA